MHVGLLGPATGQPPIAIRRGAVGGRARTRAAEGKASQIVGPRPRTLLGIGRVLARALEGALYGHAVVVHPPPILEKRVVGLGIPLVEAHVEFVEHALVEQMGDLGVDQVGGRFRLAQTPGVKSIADGRSVAFRKPVRVQIREADLDRVVVEQQGPVENDRLTTRVRNIAGLDFELLDLVGNEIALFVLAPVPASTAEAGVFEILKGKTRPVGRPGTDAAALAS